VSVIKYVVVLISGVMTSIALAAPVPAAPARAITAPAAPVLAAKPAPAPQPAVRVLIKGATRSTYRKPNERAYYRFAVKNGTVISPGRFIGWI
jgi:hypothetical protein